MATTKVVKLNELAEALGLNIEERIDEYKKAVLNACLESIPDLVNASPVDTGLYAQSWGVQEGQDSVTIGNYAPHAPIIENGARPFTPPIGPLLAWAKRVLSGTSPDGKKIETGQPESNYSPEVWSLAKGVQKKIAAVGIQPRFVLERTIPLIMSRIERELRKIG